MIARWPRPGPRWNVDDYLEAAVACAEFLLGELRDDARPLLRTYKDGRAHIPAYLDDHAYLLQALTTLYEATLDPRWYAEARRAGRHDDRALRRSRSGAASSPPPTTIAGSRGARISRTRRSRRAKLGRRLRAAAAGSAHPASSIRAPALGVLRLLAPLVGATRSPSATRSRRWTSTWPPCARWRSPGPATRSAARSRGRPRRLPPPPRAGGRRGRRRAAAGGPRGPVDGRAAAYVCEHFTCQAPVTEPEALAAALGATRTGR